MDPRIVNEVLVALQGHSINNFITTLLDTPAYEDCPIRQLFTHDCPDLLLFLSTHVPVQHSVKSFAASLHTSLLKEEVAGLALRKTGWHFSAKDAIAEQQEKFTIEGMDAEIDSQTPLVGSLLLNLLESGPARAKRRAQYMSSPLATNRTRGDSSWDNEDEYSGRC